MNSLPERSRNAERRDVRWRWRRQCGVGRKRLAIGQYPFLRVVKRARANKRARVTTRRKKRKNWPRERERERERERDELLERESAASKAHLSYIYTHISFVSHIVAHKHIDDDDGDDDVGHTMRRWTNVCERRREENDHEKARTRADKANQIILPTAGGVRCNHVSLSLFSL